jgi:hypothetical protein
MAGSSTYLRARVQSVTLQAPRPSRIGWLLVRRLRLAERELARLRREDHRPRELDAPFLKVPPVRPRA